MNLNRLKSIQRRQSAIGNRRVNKWVFSLWAMPARVYMFLYIKRDTMNTWYDRIGAGLMFVLSIGMQHKKKKHTSTVCDETIITIEAVCTWGKRIRVISFWYGSRFLERKKKLNGNSTDSSKMIANYFHHIMKWPKCTWIEIQFDKCVNRIHASPFSSWLSVFRAPIYPVSSFTANA